MGYLMRRGKGFLVFGATAALAVSLAACGSSSSGGNPTTGSNNSAATTAAPIKIGLMCTCSGPLGSQTTDTPKMVDAWASTVNAAGGINGHQVQILVKDDAGAPATSTTDVQAFVNSDHVIAIMDASLDDEVWEKFVASKNVPVVGINTSGSPFYTNPDFYAEGQTEDLLFDSIIGAAKKAGASTLGLLYCAEAPQCAEGIAPLKATGKSLGVPVTFDAEVSATAPNYTAQCVAAQQAKVGALFIADGISVIQKVGSDCTTQGYTPPIVIDGENLGPVFQTSVGIKDNSYWEVPNLPYFANTPANQAMNTALNKYSPGTLGNSTFSELTAEGWISGKLFEAAAAAGQLGANGSTPTSAQLVTGLHALKGETLGGMAPPLTYVAGKPNPVDCWYWAVLKGGKYSTPYGLAPACASS
jgi:branched-chain amino acid transport system substrate-binding protein